MENSYRKWQELEEERKGLCGDTVELMNHAISKQRLKDEIDKDRFYAESIIKLIVRAEDGLLATKILKEHDFSKLEIDLDEKEGIVVEQGVQRII